MQVKIPVLQSRCRHSATSFSLGPGLAEVVVFGGCSKWPRNHRSYPNFSHILADTVVLQFGELYGERSKPQINHVNRDNYNIDA